MGERPESAAGSNWKYFKLMPLGSSQAPETRVETTQAKPGERIISVRDLEQEALNRNLKKIQITNPYPRT